MCSKMPLKLFVFVYSILFLDFKAHSVLSEPTCFASEGSSCPSPLVLKRNCPDGFEQVENYCFKLGDEFVSWKEAQQKCEDIGAKLADPNESTDFLNEFTNYLRHYVSPYYGGPDNIFSLGGKCTSESCEWLSGGKIQTYVQDEYYGCTWDHDNNYNMYGFDCNYDETSCVRMRTKSYGWYDRQYFFIFGPCNDNTKKSRYVCQVAPGENNYRSCQSWGNNYNSGQLVTIAAHMCEQTWCQDGNMEQYNCGNGTDRCCQHEGQLYGDGDIIFQAKCDIDGKPVPVPEQKICQDGAIRWKDCSKEAQMICK